VADSVLPGRTFAPLLALLPTFAGGAHGFPGDATGLSGLVFEIWPFNPAIVISLPLGGVSTLIAGVGRYAASPLGIKMTGDGFQSEMAAEFAGKRALADSIRSIEGRPPQLAASFTWALRSKIAVTHLHVHQAGPAFKPKVADSPLGGAENFAG
jgi:hypothetical protein